MHPDIWPRVTDLVARALDVPEPERRAWIEAQTAGETKVVDEVIRLLEAHADAGRFLDDPLIAQPGAIEALKAALPLESLPERTLGPREFERIGHYRIVRWIGEGGMAEVYEAEQEHPIRRIVALKIIKWGMSTKEVIARFDTERQALALMNHPNIARVFDAGATETGRPYFAMEYVRGVRITDYCDTNRLATSQRLELFIQVCEGVQHAHQKGVIHRDIKPSNVLVEIQDEKAVPKLIDFGVAKSTAQHLTERTMFTQLGEIVGTPEYMSPEQAEMTVMDVDTRTDVYALGMLLYELLVGTLPFDERALRRVPVDQVRRTIREDEPRRLSVRLRTVGDGDQVVKNRRTDVGSLTKELRGDLDWITMKALEKDRTRRYSTASELAADIARHLRHEPVLAGPPATTYRIGKFVRRHRLGVAACAAVLMALLVGLAGTAIGLVRARRAEAVAAAEAETARQVSDFLIGLFEVSDPNQARGNTITAREILEAGASKIDRELADRPLVRARLMDTIGKVYQNLGLYGRAEPLMQEALNIRRHERGEQDLQVGTSLLALAWLYRSQGRLADGEALSRRGIEILEASLDQDHPDLGLGLRTHGVMLRDLGSLAAARPVLERSLEIARTARGPEHVDVAMAHYHLGWLLKLTGHYAEARQHYEQALPILESRLGPDSPRVAWCLNDLGVVLQNLGENDQARQRLERSLAIKEKVLGPQHPDVAAALNNLGVMFWYMGRYDESKAYYERTLAIREKALGPDHPEVASVLMNIALAVRLAGNHEAAYPLLERAASIVEKTRDPNSAQLANILIELATLYGSHGRHSEAASFYERSLETFRKSTGLDHPDVAFSQACYFAVVGQRDKAVQYLKHAVELGYRASLRRHPDLDSLHGLPEYEALAARNDKRGT
jgi:serine/threonine protein kinase/tetratricopeptide (TPR) repeat protein